MEGLTVSYMPRNTQRSTADTVQQLGRFFGYKKSYLGFCRLFLSNTLQDQFTDYVKHEESLRDELTPLSDGNEDIKKWTRRFILSDDWSSPCRKNVIDEFTRGTFKDKWVYPQCYTFLTEEVASTNHTLVEGFLAGIDVIPAKIEGNHAAMKSREAIPLTRICGELLSDYRLAGDEADRERFLGAIYQIRYYLKHNSDSVSETCDVFIMNDKDDLRTRSLDHNDKISELFQGRNPKEKSLPVRYVGDREIPADKRHLSIQIHYLNLYSKDNKKELRHSCIPVIAVWIPEKMRSCWITKAPGNHNA